MCLQTRFLLSNPVPGTLCVSEGIWFGERWSAHPQTTAAKVQRVIQLSREALAAGGCVVIGMQGTGEQRAVLTAGRSSRMPVCSAVRCFGLPWHAPVACAERMQVTHVGQALRARALWRTQSC